MYARKNYATVEIHLKEPFSRGSNISSLHIHPGGGTPHIKGVGMLVGNFEVKETDLGVAQAFFEP